MPRFCRVSIPTAFLSAPYTVRAFDSSWRDLTSAALPSADDAWAILYFQYDSNVQSIAIVGNRPTPDSPIDASVAVILAAVTIGACFAAFFATMRRRRKT
jgi:hypothetical protein